MSTNDSLILWLLQTGAYAVSNDGVIFGRKDQQLKNGKTSRYPKMEVRDQEGRVRHVSKHRLIAIALWGPIPDGHTVNHKDGCKWNADPKNLEVVPHRENIRHSYATGLQPPMPKGEKHWLAKLSDAQVAEVRQSRQSCRKLAKELGVSYALISSIRRGERRL